MKISFYTTPIVPFRGINESMKKVMEKINVNGVSQGDTFTKTGTEGGTVIIENYNDNRGQNQTSSSGLGQHNSQSSAVDGAVTGVATGSGIEGVKSAAQKIKGSKSENAKEADAASGEFREDEISEETQAAAEENPAMEENFDSEFDCDTETDLDTDIDNEIDIDTDFDVDFDTDIDIDTDIDFSDIGI